MRIDLTGRRIIVTGGANGIGAACVSTYAEAGARVVSMDIEDDKGRALVRALGSQERCHYVHCDVSLRQSVDNAFADAIAFLGGLDVMVNFAGVDASVPPEDVTEEQMRRMLDIHVMGTLFTNQAAFRAMSEKGGQIINVGSAAAIRGQPGFAHYGAAKGAVLAWTRNAALSWGKRGITVNAVAPTAFTRLVAAEKARYAGDFEAMLQSVIPVAGGLRKPEDGVAPAMLLLASEAAGYITGQTISLDGGMVMLGS